MAILDNRTLLTANDTATGIDDETGAAAGNTNTETFIEGSGSVSNKYSNATGGLFYDAGSAQDWSSNHFYIWWNVSTAGKLNTQAAGGVRVRFCGNTITNFFEVYIAGRDTYTGGFEMAVIDIETARANAVAGTLGGTGGTTPATTAIRYVGIFFDVTSMISGNVDNAFIDAMWRLPASTPGIQVEGQNTGPTDWVWDDIVDAGDIGDTTKAWGTVRKENGVVFVNTPIRFGDTDAVTHGFSDENIVIAWEDKLVADDFYGLEVIGGTGTQSFQAGLKSGTGDDAVGTQGWVVLAESTGQRWFFDASDSNIDACNLYGCTFIHSSDFTINNANVETISCAFLDGTSALISNSEYLKNSIINANTADSTAYLTTDDITDVVRSNFIFSDGYAIDITDNTVDPQVSKGNTFTSYGSDDTTDAAVAYSSTGTLTINITDGGDVPTVVPTSQLTAVASVTVTVTVSDAATTAISGAQVAVYLSSDDTEVLNSATNGSGVATTTFSGTTPAAVYIRVRDSSTGSTRYIDFSSAGTITSAGLDLSVTLFEDLNVEL